MGNPSWLYYLFAVAMLAVAAYGACLLAISFSLNDPLGRDIDIAHLFMGVAMAGMFVADWAFWPSGFWELVFFLLMVWFIFRSIQSIQLFGLHVPHQGIHAAMSFAMLMMYWFPMGSSTTGMSMSMSSSSHAILDPGIGLLLAFLFFGSAIFTLASPNKGASHHGTHVLPHVRVLATAGAPSEDGAEEVGSFRHATSGPLARITSPVLEDLSHVVMCVGMGFMLILML
jgi:Domain of unknown function (DUF5134)